MSLIRTTKFLPLVVCLRTVKAFKMYENRTKLFEKLHTNIVHLKFEKTFQDYLELYISTKKSFKSFLYYFLNTLNN